MQNAVAYTERKKHHYHSWVAETTQAKAAEGAAQTAQGRRATRLQRGPQEATRGSLRTSTRTPKTVRQDAQAIMNKVPRTQPDSQQTC